MNRRTQLIIGATLILLGGGVVALGGFEEESSVRYVSDLHDAPDAHTAGTYTLLGIPQPEVLETRGSDGTTNTTPNPAFPDAVIHSERRVEDGVAYLDTYTLRPGPAEGGDQEWRLLTETRRTDSSAVLASDETTFTLPIYQYVFPVEAFEGDGFVWAAFDEGLRDPLQPKPSQLSGRLMDGLPPGAMIYEVEELTVGCSSKFIPEDLRDDYDADGDGRTD